MKLKIKKLFLLNIVTALFLLISFSANALTIREKIQQDLSKIGLNDKIILETADLYIEYFESDFSILDEEVKDKIEKLLKRDERNFYLSEILINHYVMIARDSEVKNNKRNIQKYFDLYKKYSFYDYLKYYYGNTPSNYDKNIFKRMKKEFSGTIFEKMAPIWEKLVESDIQTRPIWGLIHQQKPYVSFQSYEMEKSLYYYDRILNLPCSSNLTEKEVYQVIEKIKEFKK